MYCKHCGSKLDDGANFCEKCGTRVDTAGAFEKTVSDETAMFNEISDAIKAAEDETPVVSEEEIKEGVEKILADENVKEEPASVIEGLLDEEEPDAADGEASALSDSENTDDATVVMKESDIKSGEASNKKAKPEKSEEKPKEKNKEKTKEKKKEKDKGSEKDRRPDSKKQPKDKGTALSYEVENAAREALGSVWIFLGIAGLCAQVALMLVYSFSGRVDEALNFLGRLFFFQDNAVIYLRIVVALVAAVEIIAVIGFILTFVSANRKKRAFKTAGLSILQALCVIGLILTAFAGLCGIGAGLVGLRYLRHYMYLSLEGVSTGQIVYVSCMAGCVLICYILTLIFFAKLITSIGRAKRAAAEGKARRNIALYNVVILFAAAICIFAFSIASLLTSALSSWMIITGELAFCFACVMFAVFMVSYRIKMKEII